MINIDYSQIIKLQMAAKMMARQATADVKAYEEMGDDNRAAFYRTESDDAQAIHDELHKIHHVEDGAIILTNRAQQEQVDK